MLFEFYLSAYQYWREHGDGSKPFVVKRRSFREWYLEVPNA